MGVMSNLWSYIVRDLAEGRVTDLCGALEEASIAASERGCNMVNEVEVEQVRRVYNPLGMCDDIADRCGE